MANNSLLYNGSKLLATGLNAFFHLYGDKDIIATNEWLANIRQGKKEVPTILEAKNDEPCKDNDDSRIICILCCSNIRNVVVLPCRHSLTCNKCAIKLKADNSPCPICRKEIKDFVIFSLP